MDAAPLSLARWFLLSLRVDGSAAVARRMWVRLFGLEQRYIFIRHLRIPSTPVEFPMETNGVVVRDMTGGDLANVLLRRSQPRVLYHPTEAMVATRAGQIVGAAWYTSSVTPERPWYEVVEPHVIFPARATASFFVVPGEKAAAWAIAKGATDRLASSGVRTIVGVIAAQNKRSILMSRLLGGKMVAEMSEHHRFGYTRTVVEPVSTDRDNAITTPSPRGTTT
jgi:hypothetical protein